MTGSPPPFWHPPRLRCLTAVCLVLGTLKAIRNLDVPALNVALNFSDPLGMHTRRAHLERARLQLRQNDLTIQSGGVTLAF